MLDDLCTSCQLQLQEEEDQASAAGTAAGTAAGGGVRHILLVLDSAEVESAAHLPQQLRGGSAGASGGASGDGSTKRRLSKMERKRLGKQQNKGNGNSVGKGVVGLLRKEDEEKEGVVNVSTSVGEEGNNPTAAITTAIANSRPQEGSCGGGGRNTKEATILLQLRRRGKYRSDFCLSFLTQEDVCASYAASIVT